MNNVGNRHGVARRKEADTPCKKHNRSYRANAGVRNGEDGQFRVFVGSSYGATDDVIRELTCKRL